MATHREEAIRVQLARRDDEGYVHEGSLEAQEKHESEDVTS